MKFARGLAVVGLVLLMACSALPGSCTAHQPLIAAYEEFRVLETRANAARPAELSPVLGEMQAARRALGQLDTRGCDKDVTEAQTRVSEWMDADIATFFAVMNDDISDEPLLKMYVQQTLEKRALAKMGIERIATR